MVVDTQQQPIDSGGHELLRATGHSTFGQPLIQVLMLAHQGWLGTQEYSWPDAMHYPFKRIMGYALDTSISPLMDILWVTSLDNQS